MKKRFQAAALAACVVMCASAAHAADFAAEVNGAKAGGVWGGEAGVSYRLNLEAMGLAGFHITPTAGAFVNKDNKTEIDAYGRLEASFSVAGFEVGAGGRYDSLTEKLRPYATARVPLLPWFDIKANAGKDYYALGVVFNY